MTASEMLQQEGLRATAQTLDEAQERVLVARHKLLSARQTLDDDLALRALRPLPGIGEQAQAALDLTAVGLLGSEAALEGIDALRRLEAIRAEAKGGLGERAVAYLEDIRPQMEAIDVRLAAIRQTLDDIQIVTLPWSPLAGVVTTARRQVDEVDRIVRWYHHARAAAPSFLGFDRPKRYLVLGQDNTELFPMGGVISLYGVATFQEGRLSHLAFNNVGKLTATWQASTGGEYIEPPAPLKRYLLREWTWNIGVSNWSPDFASAAQQALFFYERAGERPVDGVIGLDFVALEGLLAVTGPQEMVDYGVTLTAKNVVEELLVRTRHPQRPGEDRYAFAVAAATQILDAAFDLKGERWAELLEALQRLSQERHWFVYSREEVVQASLRELGWAGALAPPASDYLMVVEASVHSTKLNWIVEETMALTLHLDAEGNAHHRLTLSHRNGVDEWAQGRDPELVHDLMLSGFYGGYLRLLVPPEAQLHEVWLNGEPAGIEDVGPELGRLSFGRYFPLPAGAQSQLTFSYSLPGAVHYDEDALEYRLYIQKQAGTRAIPLRITITLPEGAAVKGVTLNGEALAGDGLSITTDLRIDRELVVRYQE